MYMCVVGVVCRMYMYCSIVAADTGNIGGTLSHEYHVTSSVGEDTLFVCQRYDGAVHCLATVAPLLSCLL